MKLFLVTASLILCMEQVICFSTGVPNLPEICRRMTPRHGKNNPPQISEPPYSVSVSPDTVAGGGFVTVTLKSIGDMKFKGFYIQGRGEEGTPIGMFTANQLTDTHTCTGIRWPNRRLVMRLDVWNAAHHASGKVEKDFVQITWQAPKDFKGQVTFFGTFVHKYRIIWSAVSSNTLTVRKRTDTKKRGRRQAQQATKNSSFLQTIQMFLSERACRRDSYILTLPATNSAPDGRLFS